MWRRASGYEFPAMRFLVLPVLVLALLAATTGRAQASTRVEFGIQDDAWLEFGPGKLFDRVAELRRLGLDAVRVTVRWDQVESTQGVYRWNRPDKLLAALHARGLDPVVTLWGTPGWANGNAGANVAPSDGTDFAAFAHEAALRYRYVTRWVVWNEPNKPIWLKPASPETYVQRLLNPAYAAIKSVSRKNRVAGGVTAPRAGQGGISPVDFIERMARAARPPRRLRAPPVSRVRGRYPVLGGLRVQDDHDGEPRPAHRARRARLPVGADLAHRIRLPDEPARPLRRLVGEPGALHRRGRAARVPRPEGRPPHPLPLPRRARPRPLPERPRDDLRQGQAGPSGDDASARGGLPTRLPGGALGTGASR